MVLYYIISNFYLSTIFLLAKMYFISNIHILGKNKTKHGLN